VIYTQDNRRSVDFTQDRTRLLAAIDAFKPGFTYGDPTTDRIHFQASIRTLAQTSAYLATVPQRRKAIVYVSTGVPLDLQVFANVTLLQPKEGEVLDVDLNTDLYNTMNELLVQRPQEAYGLTLQEALIRAQDGNVNVYSIDPAGAGGLGAYLQNRTTIEQLDAQTRAGRGVVVRQNPLEPIEQARLHRDFLEVVAENSGGRAFVNTNDFDAGLRQIFRENSSYYLVGYRSTRDRTDRRIRRVNVKMSKPGLTARTRNAYFAPRGRSNTVTPPEFRLTEALHGILPSPDITLRATAAVFALPARTESGVALAIGMQHPPLPGDIGARASGSLELLTTAHGADGQIRASMKQGLTLKGRSGADQPAEYEVLSRLDLPPGRYQLRIAARIPVLDRTGSVYYDIEVPDHRRETVSLSGVVLSAAPDVISAGADLLSTLLPLVPTSRRVFAADMDVSAYVEVYHGTRAPTAAVPVTVSVTDDADRRVVNVSDALAPDRFNDRFTAPFQFELPLDRLRAGKYLLSIEVADGNKRAKRDVRFEVR
jgi:VWFA-related protein